MKEKEKNTIVKLKEGIDGLMLIVKKLRQLIDQKDERIKELENERYKRTTNNSSNGAGYQDA